MASILVVDGDPAQVKAVATELTQSGHDVTHTLRGNDGLQRVRDERPDLLLVDAALQDISGTDVVRAVRGDDLIRSLPILMTSERAEEIDRVVAFEVGVDDFVKKPYSLRELGLRVRALLRRRRRPQRMSGVSAIGGLEIDPVAHRVSVRGQEVVLSPLELKLLATLYQRRTRVQTRNELLAEVWGSGEGVSTRTVDACVKRLRQKLGDAGGYIQTVRGVGYRFIAPDELAELG